MDAVRVVEVEPRGLYRLWLRFADGIEGEVDLSRWASRGVFASWSDPAFFEDVSVRDYGAVAWGEGDDIELCQHGFYTDLTGKSFEEMYPKPWQPLSGDAMLDG